MVAVFLVNENGFSILSGEITHMKLFLLALGLAMILEGIPYFLSPQKVKELALLLPGVPNFTLRVLGLFIMILGLSLLLAGRHLL